MFRNQQKLHFSLKQWIFINSIRGYCYNRRRAKQKAYEARASGGTFVEATNCERSEKKIQR